MRIPPEVFARFHNYIRTVQLSKFVWPVQPSGYLVSRQTNHFQGSHPATEARNKGVHSHASRAQRKPSLNDIEPEDWQSDLSHALHKEVLIFQMPSQRPGVQENAL